jgi:hypothetical protein
VVTFKTPTGKDGTRRMERVGVSGRSGNSSNRKSIRFSLARMKRPSLFGPELEAPLEGDGEDEVNRVCHFELSSFIIFELNKKN